MIQKPKSACEDKEDMGPGGAKSSHIPGCNLNLDLSLPMQRKIPPLPHVQVCLQSQHAQE